MPLTRRQTLVRAAASTAASFFARPLLAATRKPIMTDLIIVNAEVTTLDRENPMAQAVAMRDGKFLAVGSELDIHAAAPAGRARLRRLSRCGAGC